MDATTVVDKNDWRSLCPPGMPSYFRDLFDPKVVAAQPSIKAKVDAALDKYAQEDREEFEVRVYDETWRAEESMNPRTKKEQQALIMAWLKFVNEYRTGQNPFHYATVLGGIAPFLRIKAVTVKPKYGNAHLAPRTLSKIGESLVRLFVRFMVDDEGNICGATKFASLGLYPAISNTVRDC